MELIHEPDQSPNTAGGGRGYLGSVVKLTNHTHHDKTGGVPVVIVYWLWWSLFSALSTRCTVPDPLLLPRYRCSLTLHRCMVLPLVTHLALFSPAFPLPSWSYYKNYQHENKAILGFVFTWGEKIRIFFLSQRAREDKDEEPEFLDLEVELRNCASHPQIWRNCVLADYHLALPVSCFCWRMQLLPLGHCNQQCNTNVFYINVDVLYRCLKLHAI